MAPETTGFLYPFIEAEERDARKLLVDLAASANAQASQSRQLRKATLESFAAEIDEIAAEMAHRFDSKGRLFTFGNGGSATDAASVVALFTSPVADSYPACALACRGSGNYHRPWQRRRVRACLLTSAHRPQPSWGYRHGLFDERQLGESPESLWRGATPGTSDRRLCRL